MRLLTPNPSLNIERGDEFLHFGIFAEVNCF